ncbi:hypothetical protein QAD02_007578 [Eretmocerus hayati]|uniref:Uncharacterized protein n=1 Tax=Eretmocerus hayati TaxID=131215 RepID=A0ACC2N4C4_9HYME|nr:hypothetical protein QAD02_007578 [Eretmocerus hayati]
MLKSNRGRHRGLGPAWNGYQALRNPDTNVSKIEFALCLTCNVKFRKQSHKFLLQHRVVCDAKHGSKSQLQIDDEGCDSDGDDHEGEQEGENVESVCHRPVCSASNSLVESESTHPATIPQQPCSSPGQSVGRLAPPISVPAVNQVLITTNCVSSSANSNSHKKRRSNENPSSTQGMSVAEQNYLFLKVLARFGIDFNEAQSIHLKNFLEAIKCPYKIPSSKELTDEILPSASNKEFKARLIRNLSSLLLVQFHKIEIDDKDTDSYLVSVALDGNDHQLFVHCQKILVLDRVTFEDFCMKSVDMVYNQYKVFVTFIIHNTEFILERFDLTNINRSIFYIQSTDMLISRLTPEEVVFTVRGSSFEIPQRYYDAVENLNSDILQDNKSLSNAIMQIIRFAKAEATLSQSAENIIKEYLQPIHYLTIFFQPSCQDKYVDDFDRVKMLDALDSLTKSFTRLDSVSLYMERMGTFRGLFDPTTNYSTEKFWRLAMADHREFSSLAFSILKIPPNVVINNIDKIVKIL